MSLIVFLAALVFVAYELFQVRTILVEGCESRSQEDIIALSGLEYDKSIFLLDKQGVMDALATDPGIKPVSMEITYPDKITITIEERHAQGYIEKEGAYVVIDDEGWVLQVVMMPEEAEVYPRVMGLSADTFEIGKRIGTDDTFKIKVFSRVLEAVNAKGMTLSGIDLSLASDIVIHLTQGFSIELGDDINLADKLNLADAAINELLQMGKTAGALDVSSSKKAYYREN